MDTRCRLIFLGLGLGEVAPRPPASTITCIGQAEQAEHPGSAWRPPAALLGLA